MRAAVKSKPGEPLLAAVGARPCGRHRRPALDPGFQSGDRGRGKLSLGGHLCQLIIITNRLDDQAFVWLARNNGRAALAASSHPFRGIEEQTPLELLGL